MLKAVTWCAKCLFLYLVVVALAVKYAWVFALPVWSVATRFHWTQLNQFAFLLNYFLPIFTIAGFLIGLLPWHRLGRAVTNLFPSIASNPTSALDRISPILWAWLPVTLAFLTRFTAWQSRSASVFDPRHSQGRFERFFGTLNAQTPALLDNKWATDRFVFTAPMLFLMACALAVFLRHRFTARHQPPIATPEVTPEP